MKKTESQLEKKSFEVTLQEAIAMYQDPGAPDVLKSKLEAVFGKKALVTDVLERLKDASLEEFFIEAGRPQITSIHDLPEDLHEFILEYYNGIVVHEAVNQGKRLSYLDTKQRKYQTWFNMLPSGGVGFGDTCYSDANACSGDASRLSAISAKAAEVLGKNLSCQKVFHNIMNK